MLGKYSKSSNLLGNRGVFLESQKYGFQTPKKNQVKSFNSQFFSKWYSNSFFQNYDKFVSSVIWKLYWFICKIFNPRKFLVWWGLYLIFVITFNFICSSRWWNEQRRFYRTAALRNVFLQYLRDFWLRREGTLHKRWPKSSASKRILFILRVRKEQPLLKVEQAQKSPQVKLILDISHW